MLIHLALYSSDRCTLSRQLSTMLTNDDGDRVIVDDEGRCWSHSTNIRTHRRHAVIVTIHDSRIDIAPTYHGRIVVGSRALRLGRSAVCTQPSQHSRASPHVRPR